jgi:hypothetical protein
MLAHFKTGQTGHGREVEMINTEKPERLLDVSMWVAFGDEGNVLCHGCKAESCYGCIVAWRKISGNTEYFREPVHRHPAA